MPFSSFSSLYSRYPPSLAPSSLSFQGQEVTFKFHHETESSLRVKAEEKKMARGQKRFRVMTPGTMKNKIEESQRATLLNQIGLLSPKHPISTTDFERLIILSATRPSFPLSTTPLILSSSFPETSSTPLLLRLYPLFLLALSSPSPLMSSGQNAFGSTRLVKHLKTKKYYALKSVFRSVAFKHDQMQHVDNEKRLMLALSAPYFVKLCAPVNLNDPEGPTTQSDELWSLSSVVIGPN